MPSITLTYTVPTAPGGEAAALAQRAAEAAALAVLKLCAADRHDLAQQLAAGHEADVRLTLIRERGDLARGDARARRWKAAAKANWRIAGATCDLLGAVSAALLLYGANPFDPADGLHDLVARLACEAEAWRTTAHRLAPAPVADAQQRRR